MIRGSSVRSLTELQEKNPNSIINKVNNLGKFKRIRTGKNRQKVKCNKCHTVFYERYHKDENDIYYCPSCKASGTLPESFSLVELH